MLCCVVRRGSQLQIARRVGTAGLLLLLPPPLLLLPLPPQLLLPLPPLLLPPPPPLLLLLLHRRHAEWQDWRTQLPHLI